MPRSGSKSPSNKPRGFDIDRIQSGDIVLTTTSNWRSLAIQKGVRADISHAMICVGHGSVIDSTFEGVQARNLARVVLAPGCAAYVLRAREPLSIKQLSTAIAYARGMIGVRYSIKDALRSVVAQGAPSRRQFCSRLVAQAYNFAGVQLSDAPDFCTPGDLLRCQLLAPVSDVLFELTVEQQNARLDEDPVQDMRDVTNALLEGARTVSRHIESLNDIDFHLQKHPEDDNRLVEALHASGYLELWRSQTARTPWLYDLELLEARDVPKSYTQNYCADLVTQEIKHPGYFAPMRAAYMLYHMAFPLEYFRLNTELYTILAINHATRLRVAIAWLERRGLLTKEPTPYVVPHTLAWYLSLAEWDPRLSINVARAVQAAGENTMICSFCTKLPTNDYVAIIHPPAGPGTYRLCDACYKTHSATEKIRPFPFRQVV